MRYSDDADVYYWEECKNYLTLAQQQLDHITKKEKDIAVMLIAKNIDDIYNSINDVLEKKGEE